MREQSEAARGGARGDESARIVHETNNASLAATVQHDGAAFRDLFRTRTTPSAFCNAGSRKGALKAPHAEAPSGLHSTCTVADPQRTRRISPTP